MHSFAVKAPHPEELLEHNTLSKYVQFVGPDALGETDPEAEWNIKANAS